MKRAFLREPADLRTVAFVVTGLGVLLVPWMLGIEHPALIALAGFGCFVGCVVNHNHQHVPTFTSPIANRVFGVLLSLLIGQPATAIIALHNHNHHRHNGEDSDVVRPELVAGWPALPALLLFPFVAVSRFVPLKSKMLSSWRDDHPRLHARLRAERWIVRGFVLFALILQPWTTLLALGVPWFMGQWGILAINLVQHEGVDTADSSAHSRDFTGRLLNWCLLENGYHTAHHDRPGCHWSHLPALHAELEPKLNPRFIERSLVLHVLRRYILSPVRPIESTIRGRERVRPRVEIGARTT